MSGFRILLGDDHELVLEGLRSLVEAEPDMRVIATATNGRQVIDAVAGCFGSPLLWLTWLGAARHGEAGRGWARLELGRLHI